MISGMRILAILILAAGTLAFAGCSGVDDAGGIWMSAADETTSYEESAASAPAAAAGAQGAQGESGAMQKRAMTLAAPALPAQPQVAAAAGVPGAPGSPGALAAVKMIDPGDGGAEQQFAELATQRRIIIYTVDMTLEVVDVAASLDTVGALAQQMGGWVVSTSRAEKHRGFIAVRVPADRLDEVVGRLRGIAAEVVSEVSSSRDVTDEYVDLTSRLGNLQAAEAALLRLFDRAQTVEEALDVRRTLTDVQGEIEVLKGRIAFLEQTSAFSLVNVTLVLEPQDMEVDAGGEQVAGVGHPVTFRAFFKPPEGIEDFSYTWDFGDASPTVFNDRTAPTAEEGTRVTAPVTHFYEDDEGSPFFAEVIITGTGDSGVVEGKAAVIVTISEIPVIEVFAGDSITVEEDEEASFSGSFTRPEGVSDLKFTWTFGDGSPAVTGDLEAGVTIAEVTHAYADHRPVRYTATLTVTGKTDAGEVEASGSVRVRVTEKEGYVIGGWSAGETGKNAIRALSAVGAGLFIAAVWLAIFSPVWIVALAIGLFFWRRRGRRATTPRSRRTHSPRTSARRERRTDACRWSGTSPQRPTWSTTAASPCTGTQR